MGSYHHFTFEERERLFLLKQSGLSNKRIAEELGKHKSSIGRELRRNNCDLSVYGPDRCNRLYLERRKRVPKLQREGALHAYVIAGLERHWSPEQIAGRLKLEGLDFMISHETIYQYVYSDVGKRKKLAQYLNSRRSKRRPKLSRKARKTSIPALISISERPGEVNERGEIGHFEADLIFCKHSQSRNVIVITERVTRHTTMVYNPSKHADGTMARIEKVAEHLGVPVKSVTFDRGREFSDHQWLNLRGIDTYFCDPYSPWQKGTVENTNRRIRQFLPKSFNAADISQQLIDKIEKQLNNTPRKCLQYLTPNEALSRHCHMVALQT